LVLNYLYFLSRDYARQKSAGPTSEQLFFLLLCTENGGSLKMHFPDSLANWVSIVPVCPVCPIDERRFSLLKVENALANENELFT
jgi:hypothetical protein